MLNPEWFYVHTYKTTATAHDIIMMLKYPDYRTKTWTPSFNKIDFINGQLDNLHSGQVPSDPRQDPHWVDEKWDDVTIPQWWRYVAYQFNLFKIKWHFYYEELQ